MPQVQPPRCFTNVETRQMAVSSQSQNSPKQVASEPEKRPFCLIENSQSSSRLLQLPAEVRIQILEFLLQNDAPLDTAKDHPSCCTVCTETEWAFITNERIHPEADVTDVLPGRNFSFTPSILATCQSLYHQGGEILYEQNEVVINLCTTQLLQNMSVIMFDLPLNRRARVETNALAQKPEGIWKFMKRFRFRFVAWRLVAAVSSTIWGPDGFGPRIWGKVLRAIKSHLPKHADVTVETKLEGFWDVNEKDYFFRQTFTYLGLLRCHRIQFKGDVVPAHQAAELAGIITSNDPVYDLPGIALELRQYLTKGKGKHLIVSSYRANYDSKLEIVTRRNVDLLWDAACDWDLERFVYIRQGLRHRCENALMAFAGPMLRAFQTENRPLEEIYQVVKNKPQVDVWEDDLDHPNVGELWLDDVDF